jgi:hypothetical protein
VGNSTSLKPDVIFNNFEKLKNKRRIILKRLRKFLKNIKNKLFCTFFEKTLSNNNNPFPM